MNSLSGILLLFLLLTAIAVVGTVWTYLSKANQKLSSQAEDLSRHAAQMELLTQLGEYLQKSATEQEAYIIVMQFAKSLFPESSGALFILKESSINWLEKVASWGGAYEGDGFPGADCWSIRRRQPHSFDDSTPGPRCPHVTDQVKNCLCIPMILLGEVHGVMHVQWNVATVAHEDEDLITRLTEDAALALTNIRLRKQLKDLSVHDPLTGLFNRRFMEEFFSKELVRSRRSSNQLSVLMIDIDHFKKFNDTFLHEAGDAVLHELGSLLKKRMRASDVTCRYGGDEFIVLMPETPIGVSARRAEQLRQEAKLMRVKFGDALLPEITLSLGVACFPIHGDSIDELIRAADRALYEAKEQGRDRVCVATGIASHMTTRTAL